MAAPKLPPMRCWYRRVPARAVPVKLFEQLYSDESEAFVYESLESHGGRGRYSFIGSRPRAVFQARGDRLTLRTEYGDAEWRGDPLAELGRLLPHQVDAPPVAPFCGGAVGYLAYDTVRWCERIPDANPDTLGAPDAYFLFPGEVICFDHHDQLAHVMLFYDEGHDARLEQIREAIRECPAQDVAAPPPPESAWAGTVNLTPNMTPADFAHSVERAREYILAGDIFQVVLSQRFDFDVTQPPLRLYKALRQTNPSPYMYFLRLGDMHIVGSSPEILVSRVGRKVVTRPLAGTRPRGATPEEDAALAAELQADEKERAEHVMLVDLGRNDLGRVCEYGSVDLTEMLAIERHSKVMHLVSNVEGWLRDGLDAIDVYRAVFPAGTLSGAPKVRAMEIIDELEPSRRGVFGGAIGYFSLLGDLDLCIAIRTMVLRGDRGTIQVGAGIVADSVPEREFDETVNKARGVVRAVELANCPVFEA